MLHYGRILEHYTKWNKSDTKDYIFERFKVGKSIKIENKLVVRGKEKWRMNTNSYGISMGLTKIW